MLDWLLVIAAIVCAFQVMQAKRLILSTIWLACTSALVATLIYRLGAPEVAVMELSVGAGLVTVLFVFAFSIVGEITQDLKSLVPRPLAWAVSLAAILLLGWFILPLTDSRNPVAPTSFATVLWDQRGLDVIAQIVLIFSGVIGLLGLLSERERKPAKPAKVGVALTAGNSQPEVLQGQWQSLEEEGQPHEEVQA
jgi:uncharacterized MnhB-related membrane protein